MTRAAITPRHLLAAALWLAGGLTLTVIAPVLIARDNCRALTAETGLQSRWTVVRGCQVRGTGGGHWMSAKPYKPAPRR